MTQPTSVVMPVYDGVTQHTAATRAERRVRLDAWAATHRVGQLV